MWGRRDDIGTIWGRSPHADGDAGGQPCGVIHRLSTAEHRYDLIWGHRDETLRASLYVWSLYGG